MSVERGVWLGGGGFSIGSAANCPMRVSPCQVTRRPSTRSSFLCGPADCIDEGNGRGGGTEDAAALTHQRQCGLMVDGIGRADAIGKHKAVIAAIERLPEA